jgi:hypothetical protein
VTQALATMVFGWQLLHGALRCSATAVLWCKVGTVQELRAAVCCSATACAGDEALEGAHMESMSHLFVHCPVVRPAVAWLRGVWAMLVAGRVPPLDARVLLAGDHAVWDGAGGGEAGAELWTHLRLLCGLVPALLQSGPWPRVLCFCCQWWLWLLPRYDGLSGLTGFGCLLTLQGRR